MARCRFVQPETVTIQLSEGYWIEVKKRLSVGEERYVMAQALGAVNVQDGTRKPNLEVLGMGEVAAYLVDWNFTDVKGKPVPIDSEAAKLAAIKGLDDETYDEIDKAIDAHKAAMEREIAEAKKTRAGSVEPVAT